MLDKTLAIAIECALRTDDGFITGIKAVVIANTKKEQQDEDQ